jgi:hypothetical protein
VYSLHVANVKLNVYISVYFINFQFIKLQILLLYLYILSIIKIHVPHVRTVPGIDMSVYHTIACTLLRPTATITNTATTTTIHTSSP